MLLRRCRCDESEGVGGTCVCYDLGGRRCRHRWRVGGNVGLKTMADVCDAAQEARLAANWWGAVMGGACDVRERSHLESVEGFSASPTFAETMKLRALSWNKLVRGRRLWVSVGSLCRSTLRCG